MAYFLIPLLHEKFIKWLILLILSFCHHSEWIGVATWRWVANDDNCGICRMAFDGCCPDCKIPGDDCPLVWGRCSHVFHMHCILKWLNSQLHQQLCPMCRQEWQFKE
nr:anaphase-promoting complex subunit 11-like isoform X1 [Pocillopora verrucosa]